jgi:hypothetical protein
MTSVTSGSRDEVLVMTGGVCDVTRSASWLTALGWRGEDLVAFLQQKIAHD